MFANLILRILMYFAGLTGLFVMSLKCPTDSARFRFFTVDFSTTIVLQISMSYQCIMNFFQ